ncbi:MAG: ankyrin repeat domain-containing protein [Candidatus Eremiobacteraeota bacterium]|nr:ankyrin repeat domain-containing protein [Candidatus Eremiobacteraeota bacterium]
MGSLFKGSGALHDAVTKSDIGKVTEILAKDPRIVNEKNKEGLTPLHLAALEGNVVLLELLLKKGARINELDTGKTGNTALFLTARNGYLEATDFLLSMGADINIKGKVGMSALFGAVASKKPEVIKLLVEKGADINAVTDQNVNVLELAAVYKDIPTAELLLSMGSDADVKNNAIKQLFLAAAEGGSKAVIETLIARGMPLDVAYDDGLVALHHAACYGYMDIAKLLLDKGAPINVKEPAEWKTPLHFAVYKDLRDMVAFLISRGADVNAQTNEMITPLHISKSGAIAEMLLEAGANVNTETTQHMTPLLSSIAYADTHQVEVLLDWGADLNAKIQGMTVLQFVRSGKRRDVTALVEQFSSGARRPTGGKKQGAQPGGPQAAPGYKPAPQSPPGYKPAAQPAPGYKPQATQEAPAGAPPKGFQKYINPGAAAGQQPAAAASEAEELARYVTWEKEKKEMRRLEREKDTTDYDSLLKELLGKVRKSDPTVDFTLLRKAYSRSSLYSPYDMQRLEDTKMVDALGNQGQWNKLLELTRHIFSYNPVEINSHFWSAFAHNKTGNAQMQQFHAYVYKGLLNSLQASGDGRSKETAYQVISIKEEYAVLENIEGLSLVGRQKIEDAASSYDVFEVQTQAGRETVYFNIDALAYH